MNRLRLLAPTLAALAVLLTAPSPALASCLRQTTAEQVARAEVIVYGTVTETRQTFVAAGGVIRFRPERVLKGTLTREVEVFLGPTHGGATTSVDYTAVIRGEGHTLYLRSVADGSFETDSCSGSHVGLPTAEEQQLLGPGTLVAAAGDTQVSPAFVALVAAGLALAVALLYAGWRRQRGAGA